MFDYSNETQPQRLSIRIGKQYRKVGRDGLKPQAGFIHNVQSGFTMRFLTADKKLALPVPCQISNHNNRQPVNYQLTPLIVQIRPHWSAGIDLAKPLGLVSLKCAQGQMRPDKVYWVR